MSVSARVLRKTPAIVAMLVALAVVVGSVTGWLFGQQRDRLALEIDRQLELAGRLKTDAIASWVQDRITEALLVADVLSLGNHGDLGREASLRSLLDTPERGERLGVMVADSRGRVLSSSPDDGGWLPAEGVTGLLEKLRSKGPRVVELFVGAGGRKVAVIAVELTEGDVLLLGIDPERRLFPLMKDWPGDLATTETFVAAPSGDDMLFLAPTRLDPAAALERRVSQQTVERPVVQALMGARGLVDGEDYRGTPVRAYVEAIPGTDWLLVSKIDRDEFLDPLRRQAWMFGAVALLVALAMGAGVAWWRARAVADAYQRELQLRSVVATMDASLRLHAAAFESTDVAMVLIGADSRAVAVNPAFVALTGQQPEAAVGTDIKALLGGGAKAELLEEIRRSLRQHGGWRGELECQRPNGSAFPAAVRLTRVLDAEGRFRHLVGVFADLSERHEHQRRIERLTHYDAATGLPNRLLAQARLEHEMAHVRQDGGLLAAVSLEIDGYADIVYHLDSGQADDLLRALVARWRAELAEVNLIARTGTSQFMVIVENLRGGVDAGLLAQRLIAVAGEPLEVAGDEVRLGISAGIAVYPGDGESSGQLLRAASVAVHRARSEGGGRVAQFSPQLAKETIRMLRLEAALRRALQRGQFELHYQPKVSLASGKVAGAEALLRWRRDGGDLVASEEFIPTLERLGLIAEVGRWVLHTACAELMNWRARGLLGVTMAVNVSGQQFALADFDAQVADALRSHDVPRGFLELDLTESMLMGDAEHTGIMLGKLKALGTKLALDDFGTGYSSLGYLTRFQLDSLKIDRSFVQDVAVDPRAAAVSAAVIDLGQRMGLKVVAEGVETAEQLAFMRRHGCDEMQGYLFSRPLPADEFPQVLSKTLLVETDAAAAGQQTLLVVDDEPEVIAALRRELRKQPYRVMFASSGEEALACLAREPAQVVLSDHRMHGMSGVEFLARVRQMYPDVVRLMLSGYADVAAVTEAINEGAVHRYLSKPWEEDGLRDAIAYAFRTYHRQHGQAMRVVA